MTRLSLKGELLTDVSSWTVLRCYLIGAAWIGWPPAWPPTQWRPPGTDFGRVAVTALMASREGLPDRREVRAAVILNEAKHWLADSGEPSRVRERGAELLHTAAVHVQALCPPAVQPAALDLLDPAPLEADRARWRRRHPIRARRHPDLPHVLDPACWQESLWWQRATHHGDTTAPLVHSTAGIAAAVWTWPGAVRDPIGIREELRDRIVRGRAWAASGDLGT